MCSKQQAALHAEMRVVNRELWWIKRDISEGMYTPPPTEALREHFRESWRRQLREINASEASQEVVR